MEAERKLQGAAYHLQRMEEVYLKNDEFFTYELEAFLVKLKSVTDVLLEDFNEKFSLGISLEKKLTSKIFENKARQLQNYRAISFIQWWNNKIRQIRSDQLGSILFKKRNISIHRKVVKPDLKRITLYETIHYSVTVRAYDEKGNLIKEVKSPETPQEPEKPKPKPPEVEWYFIEYPNENVLEVSKKLFQMIKGFVEEAKNRFN